MTIQSIKGKERVYEHDEQGPAEKRTRYQAPEGRGVASVQEIYDQALNGHTTQESSTSSSLRTIQMKTEESKIAPLMVPILKPVRGCQGFYQMERDPSKMQQMINVCFYDGDELMDHSWYADSQILRRKASFFVDQVAHHQKVKIDIQTLPERCRDRPTIVNVLSYCMGAPIEIDEHNALAYLWLASHGSIDSLIKMALDKVDLNLESLQEIFQIAQRYQQPYLSNQLVQILVSELCPRESAERVSEQEETAYFQMIEQCGKRCQSLDFHYTQERTGNCVLVFCYCPKIKSLKVNLGEGSSFENLMAFLNTQFGRMKNFSIEQLSFSTGLTFLHLGLVTSFIQARQLNLRKLSLFVESEEEIEAAEFDSLIDTLNILRNDHPTLKLELGLPLEYLSVDQLQRLREFSLVSLWDIGILNDNSWNSEEVRALDPDEEEELDFMSNKLKEHATKIEELTSWEHLEEFNLGPVNFIEASQGVGDLLNAVANLPVKRFIFSYPGYDLLPILEEWMRDPLAFKNLEELTIKVYEGSRPALAAVTALRPNLVVKF